MDQSRDEALRRLHSRHDQDLELLREFLRIPSVSTEPERRDDVLRAASWLADALRALKMDRVEVLPTGGPPVVFAETRRLDPQAPRLLVYGHYDVQPVDPLELWDHDPFEPAIVGEHLLARGASDMKGQIVAALSAVTAFLGQADAGVQVKFLFEGEEEVGSPHLLDFLRRQRELLEADLCLNPDTGMMGTEMPTITYGLRGLAYFELRLQGPAQDLHSGAFGGVIHNPAQALCELVAGMHDSRGRVTLPEFYDAVRPLSAEERRQMRELPTDEAFHRRTAGVPMLWGEEGFTAAERIGARPTLEVNGLLAGFTAQGSKTVLPARAMAKLSMRLVPDQDPDAVEGQLRAYLDGRVPPTIRWELERLAAAPPSLSDRESPGISALSAAMETVWQRPPLFRREGGSVPVTAYLQELLNMESVLTGFALPDDNAHSPNERLHLPTWERGRETLLHFLCNLNEMRSGTNTDLRGGKE